MDDTNESQEPPIDLWYVLLDKIDTALADEYLALLSDDEREHVARFAHEPSRQQSLASRALLRTVLSQYLGEDPRKLVFQRNAYGKPSLKPPCKLPIEFNLSNTRGLVVCAVAQRHAVGIDVEPLDRQAEYLGLARHYFAAPEIALLEQRPPAEQRQAFIELWTLKEAFIKARGMGLSLPLDSFAFDLSAGHPPRISLLARSEGVSRDWQFAQLELADQYQIALAVQRAPSMPLAIQLHHTLPLRWQEAARQLPENINHRWNIGGLET